MAVLYRCDLCKNLFTNRGEVKPIEIPRLDYHKQRFTDESDGATKEICAGCARRIVNLMEEIDKASNVRPSTDS